MATTTQIKIVIITALIVSAMSGCIGIELVDLQAPITDDIIVTPIQDPEPTAELTTKTVATQKTRHIQVSISQQSDALAVTVNGGNDFQQLKELQIIVNDATVDIYSPEYQVTKTIKCTTSGSWEVVCRGIFDDGEIHTLLTTSFGGLPDPESTTIAPERYVEPSGTSREDAKRICEENGVVWACDDPTPVPTKITTPTSIPTPAPTVMPTPDTISQSKVPRVEHETGSYISSTWQINIRITDHIDDNEIIFGTASTRYGGWRPEESLDQLKLIKIYVDDQLVATITPDVIDNPRGGHQIMNNTCIIKLPDGLTNSGEITMKGTFVDLISHDGWDDLVDGEYRMYSYVHKSHGTYVDYPIYQG